MTRRTTNSLEDNYDIGLIQVDDVGNTDLHPCYHKPKVIIDDLAVTNDGSNAPCHTQVQEAVNKAVKEFGLWKHAEDCKYHRLPQQSDDNKNGILAHVRIIQLTFSYSK